MKEKPADSINNGCLWNVCKPLPTKYLVIQGGFKIHKCFNKVYNLFLQSCHLLSIVLVWETVLIKKNSSYWDDFFLSVSNEIPLRPDFVFCIQVFSSQLTKEDGMNLYFQRKQSYHISPCLSCQELCLYSAIKSEQSLILYNTFVFTLEFQANKLTFRNSTQQGAVIAGDCGTKFPVDRRFNPKKNTTQWFQVCGLPDFKYTTRQISCWSSVHPKKEYDHIIPNWWFAKFQVHHPSSGQSIEWNCVQFHNILRYPYLKVCTASQNIPPFWRQFPVVGDMKNQVTLWLWYLICHPKRLCNTLAVLCFQSKSSIGRKTKLNFWFITWTKIGGISLLGVIFISHPQTFCKLHLSVDHSSISI